MAKISVSFFSVDDKKEVIKKLNKTNADYLHIDVGDGNFIEKKTIEFSKMKELLKDNKLPLDVHLMALNPSKLIDNYALLNTEFITIHFELGKEIDKYISQIKFYGIRCGISIKPETRVEYLFNLLDKIDLVLIMSVEPGKSGQSFIDNSLNKIEVLKEEIKKRSLNVLIEVDGGINLDTSKLCIEKGTDIIVSESYITSSNNYQDSINKLRNN